MSRETIDLVIEARASAIAWDVERERGDLSLSEHARLLRQVARDLERRADLTERELRRAAIVRDARNRPGAF